MTLYAELPKAAAGAQFFRSNSCPQCGDKLLAPEWSEHVNERCIRHFWSCEACGYEFESSVYLSAR
jgi:C4-type Zn-finger protein